MEPLLDGAGNSKLETVVQFISNPMDSNFSKKRSDVTVEFKVNFLILNDVLSFF